MAENETREEESERQLNELLQELRIMLPGVEILFAFLLTVPFSNRWEQLAGHSKALFMVTLGSAALAIALLIAPTAMHRIQGRGKDKSRLVRTSTAYSVTGMGFLVLAITTGLFIVADFVYGFRVGIPMAAVLGVVFLALWYLIPLRRRQKLDGD